MLRTQLVLGGAIALAVTVPAGGAAAAEKPLPKPKTHTLLKVNPHRHGKVPKGMHVRLKGRTERNRRVKLGHKRRPHPSARPTAIPKPKAGIAIGGWHGPYGGPAGKMAWIQYWVDDYERRILGSYYRQPGLYPDAAKYSSFNCPPYASAPVVNNAMYCPSYNYIAWDTNWFLTFFNAVGGGDMSVAAIYAHEWGHGSQYMLNLRGPKVAYQLNTELYADCMSGAWAAYMYNRRLLDNLGAGDYNEALNVMAWIGAPNVPTRTHGNVTERQSFFRYGWTNGAQTCVNWLQS